MAEKEYVLGNKAKDLYQYTRQVTKPGADEKVDVRDVATVMRKMATAGNAGGNAGRSDQLRRSAWRKSESARISKK